jgi:hypothetical protein
LGVWVFLETTQFTSSSKSAANVGRTGFLLGGVTKIEFFYSSIHYVPIVETLQAVAMQNWITVV